jgi:hypothetical protein
MNPMELLTVGKSLMDIKSATGRYRMAEGNLFPKFNSTVRTGADAPTVKAEPIKLVMDLQMKGQVTAQTKTESKLVSIKHVVDRVREYFLNIRRFMFKTPAAINSSVTGKLKAIRLLSRWKGRQLRTGTERIGMVKSALQGELSLDKVKVVRNDLSDTDLEIVSVRNVEQSKSSEPVPATANQGESTELSFARLTTRIFGARQTTI